jgi:hypothetical protein
MAALPPPLDFSTHRGRAAEIGAMVLGVLVAIGVALMFIVVIGADSGRRWAAAGAGYRSHFNSGQLKAAPAASRSSRRPKSSSVGGSHGHFKHRSDGARQRRDRVVIDVEHLHAVTRRRLRTPPHPPPSTGQGEGCHPRRARRPRDGRARCDDIGMTVENAHIRPSRRGFRGCLQPHEVALSTRISCGSS